MSDDPHATIDVYTLAPKQVLEHVAKTIGLPAEKIPLLDQFLIGVTPENAHEALPLATRNANVLMEYMPLFSGVVALHYWYHETLGVGLNRATGDAHAAAFRRSLARGIELGITDPRLLTHYDLDKICSVFDTQFDLLDVRAITNIYDRYSQVDKSSSIHVRLEVPQSFYMRVAMGLFLNEDPARATDLAIELWEMYVTRRFCSSTPTLFNAGTTHPQLSSCFLYHIEDSLEDITGTGIAKCSQLIKWAGGLGGSWTSVRGLGARIKGTNGEAQGTVPFLKMHNDLLAAVSQGSRRKGTGCAYLEVWHSDIHEFLQLRKNVGDDRRRTHDMNTAAWVPDLFMERMEARAEWTLFHSNDVPYLHDAYGDLFRVAYEEAEAKAARGEIWCKKVAAIDLWKDILKALFETGHPWITFKDPCNLRNPQKHCGVVHSSNLCTEITLNTSSDEIAVCNLGSINLSEHIVYDSGAWSGVADLRIDWAKLTETIRVAVRALDNVIDINYYPVAEARNSNQRHRPIGLGLMGLHDAALKLGIPFDSEQFMFFNHQVMEHISYHAIEASSDLAKERGSYSSFDGSLWSRGALPPDTAEAVLKSRSEPYEYDYVTEYNWDELRRKVTTNGMRNSNVMAIAPTATISHLSGCSPCIEPNFSSMFVNSNLSGDFIIINSILVDRLKRAGLWSKELFQEIKNNDGEIHDIAAIPEEIRHLFKTAFQIPWDRVIEAAAIRQRFIDQSQSTNLWAPVADLKTISHMYRTAWRRGLKTTYYLRTLGASAVENVSVPTSVDGSTSRATCSLDNPEGCAVCQ